MKKWNNDYTDDVSDIYQRILQGVDYLEEGRTELDLVYEAMLKYGIKLTCPVKKSANGKAYIVEDDTYNLLICSQIGLNLEDIESFMKENAGVLLFADRCFTDDNLLINTEEMLKAKGKKMELF